MFLFCVVTLFGCGPNRAPMLYIYCNETFWYVLQEEALAFNKAYGFRIVLIPIRAPRTSEETENTVEINGAPNFPRLWQNKPGMPTETQQDHIHPEIDRQIEQMAEDSFGDLFLSDSQKQVAKLQQTALSASEFPVCYLTLTMLVPTDNPHQFRSLKDVLESNRRLGIMDPSLDGLGESSWTVLGKIVPGGESAIPMDLVQLYERQYDLLEALELGHIDAALVWNATSPLNFLLIKYAEEYNEKSAKFLREAEQKRDWEALRDILKEMREILSEEKSFAEEVPLTENPDERLVIAVRLIALSSTSNYGYCKRFADFMHSNQGRDILYRFGFVAE